MSDVKRVYAAIAAVSAEIATTGISKGRENKQQGYVFRGIDDVYNALAPILAKHKLVILPRVIGRNVVERQTQKGGVLFYVTCDVEFDFVSAEDGSTHVVKTVGEAMDSGDKATNKAMSAAYKYAAMQTFCIPTEGDHDSENETHAVAATAPDGYDDWLMDMEATVDAGEDKLKDAWMKSNIVFRRHLTLTNNKKWEEMKAKAVENDHARVKAQNERAA